MASVRTRFAIVCAFGAAVAVGIATAGLIVEMKLGQNMEDMATTTTALRNHTLGDMLHDTLRADVYAAFLAAQNVGEAAEVEKDVTEHAAAFRERIAANASLGISRDARAALDDLSKPLKEYIDLAETIVREASQTA